MPSRDAGPAEALRRARLALRGLSIGDAFGERFFAPSPLRRTWLEHRELPPTPWEWTDDTAMAISVVDVLEAHQGIDRDALAHAFAERYAREPERGYGPGTHRVLQEIRAGRSWHHVAPEAFGGRGSLGNGAAMRAAPVGAYFANALDLAARHADRAAQPTHAHPEGRAGAVAVAVAAATAWQMAHPEQSGERSPQRLIRAPIPFLTDGPTSHGLQEALCIPLDADVGQTAEHLGNGTEVTAADTVPFCLWMAARHLEDFEEAMWSTVSGLGDRDTTCAIVGGIVALSVGDRGLPDAFERAREPLDASGS